MTTNKADKAWLEDWTTIVQSEIAAWAVDPEMGEGLAAWARLMQAMPVMQAAAPMQRSGREQGIDGDDAQAASPAGSGDAAGTAAAGAASVAGGDATAELQARIAELERRVAALERKPARRRKPGALGPGAPGPGAPGPGG